MKTITKARFAAVAYAMSLSTGLPRSWLSGAAVAAKKNVDSTCG